MELWDIYHRYSPVDANVPLRAPLPGDVAAQNTNTDSRLLVVTDGQWAVATRDEFDDALVRFKCIKR